MLYHLPYQHFHSDWVKLQAMKYVNYLLTKPWAICRIKSTSRSVVIGAGSYSPVHILLKIRWIRETHRLYHWRPTPITLVRYLHQSDIKWKYLHCVEVLNDMVSRVKHNQICTHDSQPIIWRRFQIDIDLSLQQLQIISLYKTGTQVVLRLFPTLMRFNTRW